MTVALPSAGIVRAAKRIVPRSDLCTCFSSLSIQHRSISSTVQRNAVPSLHPTTMKDRSSQAKSTNVAGFDGTDTVAPAAYKDMTPAQRVTRATERARERLREQQEKFATNRKLGGLASNSFFAEEPTEGEAEAIAEEKSIATSVPLSDFNKRSLENMSFSLNPNPNARAQWQKKMLIRHIRRRGRLTKEVQIARTERNHMSKSHFFKTSMKKLAPLARQIAGKSIDQAILQMRFSKKKAAKEVRAHLIQARNEAIVIKGMGLNGAKDKDATADADSPVVSDPGISPPLSHQTPTKSIQTGLERSPTDIYVAEAWVNRGPYGKEPEFRARGRVNILRPPWTGISVLLKEEKTRTREKSEREAKAIRKRMGKNMWLQLPDRPITRQSQYVLW